MNAGADDAVETIYDDFATPGAWPGDKWYRHRVPACDLWDPATVVTCTGAPERTLAVEARRFTLGRRDGHDNVKALVYSTAEFAPGKDGIISVATDMRVTTFGTDRNPYGAERRRRAARLRCAQHHRSEDLDGVRLLRQRQPDRPALREAAVRREQGQSVSRVHGIDPDRGADAAGPSGTITRSAYDRSHDRVAWLVDGKIVAERERVGAPPGEAGPIVKVDSIKIGGGLFTLFGDLKNDRQTAGIAPVSPASIRRYERTLFGQGARVEFRPFKVACR